MQGGAQLKATQVNVKRAFTAYTILAKGPLFPAHGNVRGCQNADEGGVGCLRFGPGRCFTAQIVKHETRCFTASAAR